MKIRNKLCVAFAILLLAGLVVFAAYAATLPREQPVERQFKGYLLDAETQTPVACDITVRGKFTHRSILKRIENQFQGTIAINGREYFTSSPLYVLFPREDKYTSVSAENYNVIMCRDQSYFVMEFYMDDKDSCMTNAAQGSLCLLVAPAGTKAELEASLTQLDEIFRQNPAWEDSFQWNFNA